MIKSKLFITNISLIFTSLLSVSLIIVSSIYSHQLSVLKRGYQIQSVILQRYQKNIVYQECQTPTCDDMLQCVTKDRCSQFITLSNCQEQYEECQIEERPTPNKSSNLFLLKGTYEGQTYQKLIKFQIISSNNTDYTIEEVCTEQNQTCEYSPDNIITLNTDGELELTTGNDATNNVVHKLLSDDSTTWTTSSWGMPWSKNAIKVNLPVYASESGVLLQNNVQKIKSSSSISQIDVSDKIESIYSSSIETINSQSTTTINVNTITNINSNYISNITINNESITKKESAGNDEPILEGNGQLNSSENGISYINSPKIYNISSNTIEAIDTGHASSIKLTSVGVADDTAKTAIEITNGVSGRIKIRGNISCNSETEACVNLIDNIHNTNDGYALNVSGNVKSPILFHKSSIISATFTNEGTLSDVVNKGTMSSFTNNVDGILSESITNKGTATSMKNEGGTITNGLQINGGTIGSNSTKYGLSINGNTTIQGSDIGILIGNDGINDDIKIQTSGGVYGILMQQGTIGHTELHRGINIDNRANYNTNSPYVNIYSSSNKFNDQDSYAIFVGSNNVKLHSSTSENSGDTHTYYYMEPQIHSEYLGIMLSGTHYKCAASKEDN